MIVLHVTALECVDKVGNRRISGRHRDLHPALRHHAVRITQPQLGRQDHFGVVMVCMQRRGTTGPAATDNQHIRLVVGRQIGIVRDRTVTFKQGRQLDDGLLVGVGTETNRSIGASDEIRVMLVNQLIAVGGRKFRKGLFASGIPSFVYDLLQRVNIHVGRSTKKLLYRRTVVGQFFFVHLEDLLPLIIKAAILDLLNPCIQS